GFLRRELTEGRNASDPNQGYQLVIVKNFQPAGGDPFAYYFKAEPIYTPQRRQDLRKGPASTMARRSSSITSAGRSRTRSWSPPLRGMTSP
ncbi:unnamed protein product, partial [Phaeothamnion confervicola]